MKSTAIIIIAILISSCASAGYKQAIMEPWVGATQEELTAQWGYPQSANDLFKIDEETVIYTYRSERHLPGADPWGHGSARQCAVSFTIKSKVVAAYKYEGGNCPRFKRPASPGHASGTER